MNRDITTAPRNGLGIAGIVLGLAGLVFAFISSAAAVAWPLVIIGLSFSLIGIVRPRRTRADKRLAVAGAALSATGLLACAVVSVAVGATGDKTQAGATQHRGPRAERANPPAVSQQHTAVFELTTFQAVDIRYGDIDDQRTITVGPAEQWRQEIGFEEGPRRLTLSATPTDGGDSGGFDGTITCSITVDGTTVVRRSSSFGVWCNASVDG